MVFRALVIAVSLGFTSLVSGGALAQAPVAALAGFVSSPESGAMEGVLVSAGKTGASITVTVVTDSEGRFSFPASRLAPGQYSLGVRAVGYDLEGHKLAEVTEQKTTKTRSPVAEDRGSRCATIEWRMVGEHTRHRPTERPVAQLRRVSHARTHNALKVRRGCLPKPSAAAHAGLCEPEHTGPSAIAPR
jgi:hypothetical protein